MPTTVQYRLNDYWIRSKAIGITSGAVPILEIPANVIIPPYGVVIDIVTAFSGGTPSIDIGDTDADGWIDTTNITEGTEGVYAGTAAAAAYNLSGKIYTSKDILYATMSTGLTAGKAYVFVHCIPVDGVLD